MARIGAAASTLRAALATSAQENNAANQGDVRMALRGLAREVASVARPNRRDPWVAETLAFVSAALEVGAHDLPADGEDVAAARKLIGQGWPGLLAAMLLVPAWQLSVAPGFDDVPEWMWGEYAVWLFTSPLRFSNAATDVACDREAKRLRDLERLVGRNAGSASIRTAIDGYLQATGRLSSTVLAGWRQQAESRGKILSRAHLRTRDDYDPVVEPRHGRRLRLGFVARDFGPSPATFTALASFEQLDAKAFDAFLYPLVASDAPEAAYCSRRVRASQVLPGSTAERVAVLRNAQLDVVVFVGDLAAEWNELTELALHRVAPLQVANHRTGFSTGLPEIDLYVSGAELESAAFTERLGILRGPAHSFAFARTDAEPAPSPEARTAIGLPADRTLLVTLVDFAGAEQSRLETWTSILAQTPNSHLAIAFVDETAGSQVARFCLAVDRALAVHGVEQSRVTIFPTASSRPHESRALLTLGDVYLDAAIGGISDWAAVEALRAGVPVITSNPCPVQAPVALLESLGLSELATADAASGAKLASALAVDPTRRTAIRDCIRAAMEATPAFMDTLAAGDAFGALIESAFDELASLGRFEFRRQTEPVRCFGLDTFNESVDAGLAAHARGDIEGAAMEANLALRSAPLDTRVRYLQGLVLHAQGNTSRAVDYLVAAVQRSDATSEIWFSLAKALRDNRQPGEAIQVLETCIRLDGGNVEALFMLLELAEAAGATEIARAVLECLKQAAPEDPRVIALS